MHALSTRFGRVVIGFVVSVIAVGVGGPTVLHLIQDDAEHVGAQPSERGQYTAYSLALGFAGATDYQHAVNDRRDLQRLREPEQRRRVDNHQVVGFTKFVQHVAHHGADEVGG